MSLEVESLSLPGRVVPISLPDIIDGDDEENGTAEYVDGFSESRTDSHVMSSTQPDNPSRTEKTSDISNNNDTAFVSSEIGDDSCKENLNIFAAADEGEKPRLDFKLQNECFDCLKQPLVTKGNTAESQITELVCSELLPLSEDDDDDDESISDQLMDDLCIDESGVDDAPVAGKEDEEPLLHIVVEKQEDRQRPSYFSFKLSSSSVIQNKHRKSFKCDICAVNYRHMYSLKRHYLKTHINHKYISEQDLIHCCITSSVKAEDDTAGDSTQQRDGIHRVIDFVNDDAKAGKEHGQVSMPGIYKCNLCLEFFDTREQLCSHLQKHPGPQNQDGSFRCHHCDMVFSMKRYLQRHMTVHVGSRKWKKASIDDCQPVIDSADVRYSCSQCSEVFADSEALMSHIDTHDKQTFIEADKEKSLAIGISSSGYKYGCTMCKKLFSNYLNMCRHRRLAHHVSQRLNGRIRSFHSPIYNLAQKNPMRSYFNQVIEEEPIDNIGVEYYLQLSKTVRENLSQCIDGTADCLNIRGGGDDEFRVPESPVKVTEQAPPKKGAVEICPEIKKEITDGILESSIRSYQKVIDMARHLLAKSETVGCDDCCYRNKVCDIDPDVGGHRTSEDDTSLFVCFTCYNVFFDRNELMEHKSLDHPTILTTHLEMIGETECPSEIRHNNIDAVGMLDAVAEASVDAGGLSCTKCGEKSDTVTTLHSHILECGADKSLAGISLQWSMKWVRRRRQKGMKRHFAAYEPDDVAFKKPFSVEQPEEKVKLPVKNVMGARDVVKHSPGSPISEELPSNLLPHQELRCEGCYMKFDYIAALERHQRACTMARRLNGIKSSARGLYSRHNPTSSKRRCQHCLLSFSYLASLRKHMEEGCIQQDISLLQKKVIVKKGKVLQKKKGMLQAATASSTPDLPCTMITIEPVSAEHLSNAEATKSAPIKEMHFCNSCNKSFSCSADYDKHSQDECPATNATKTSDDKEALPSRDQVEESLVDLMSTQAEQKKLLSGVKKSSAKSKLQTFPCDICHTIYFSYVKLLSHRLSHKLEKSETERMKLELERTETGDSGTPGSTPSSPGQPTIKYLEKDCTCPVCNRLFASPLNMGRHKRMAHGIIRAALNQRRVILSQQTKEEKASGQRFRVCVSKVEKDGKEETQFVVQPKDPVADAAAKVPKKRGRKPKVLKAEDGANQPPRKRGWPKGKKRKVSTEKTSENQQPLEPALDVNIVIKMDAEDQSVILNNC